MKPGGCLVLMLGLAVLAAICFGFLRGPETTTPQSVAATANAEYERSQMDLDPDSNGSVVGTLAVVVMVSLALGFIAAVAKKAASNNPTW